MKRTSLNRGTRTLNRTRLSPMSGKRYTQVQTYLAESRKFLKDNPVCQYPGCKAPSTETHHKSGREGEKLNDKDDWLAICNPHHRQIHDNPKEAREMGLLKDYKSNGND